MVYLKIPYRHASLSAHRSVKLHSKYYGPFRVLHIIGHAAYKLLLPAGCQSHDVFHVSQLKKHIGSHVVPSPDLPLVDDKGMINVASKLILERRLIQRNNEPVAQWLIKWTNLSTTEASCEDAQFIRKVFPAFHPCGQGCFKGGALSGSNIAIFSIQLCYLSPKRYLAHHQRPSED